MTPEKVTAEIKKQKQRIWSVIIASVFLLEGKMTTAEKDRIHEMRLLGISYSQISSELNISENTIKSYCRRHNLGKTTAKKTTGILVEKDVCKHCGKPIKQGSKGKHKKFCTEECRRLWWKANDTHIQRKAYYTLVCHGCGKSFKSYGNAKRKFCSHACYINNRFKNKRKESL
jgi:Sigma-70, region 4.